MFDCDFTGLRSHVAASLFLSTLPSFRSAGSFYALEKFRAFLTYRKDNVKFRLDSRLVSVLEQFPTVDSFKKYKKASKVNESRLETRQGKDGKQTLGGKAGLEPD